MVLFQDWILPQGNRGFWCFPKTLYFKYSICQFFILKCFFSNKKGLCISSEIRKQTILDHSHPLNNLKEVWLRAESHSSKGWLEPLMLFLGTIQKLCRKLYISYLVPQK